MLPKVRSWLRAVLKRSHLEAEMESEIRFHIESYIEDLVRSGVSLEEAARRAKVEFGGIEAHKDGMRGSLGLHLWDELWADIRYGTRLLVKSPSFAAIAILSLALGIGANTIIFSLAKQVLLDLLPVPHPEQLRSLVVEQGDNCVVHSFWGSFNKGASGKSVMNSFSYPVYQELRKQNRGLEDIFAYKLIDNVTATLDSHAQNVRMEMVSGNYFEQMRVQPALGRAIQPQDDALPGAGAVAVISDSFWAQHFGRSPSVIGKTIQVNLQPVTIVGINPSGFHGMSKTVPTDLFVPLSMQPVLAPRNDASLLTDKELWWVQLMARIKPGVPEETARAALDVALGQAVRATTPPKKDETLPTLLLIKGGKGQDGLEDRYGRPVMILSVLAGFVLLIACANIANLLLARSSARQREMGVRLAMGASRGRLLRQILTESLLLSFSGGLVGLVLAYLGHDIIPNILFSSWNGNSFSGGFDWKIFGFTSVVSMLTGVLCGVGPAWLSSRASVSTELKDSATTATHRRRGLAGRSLVVLQVSLSMLLMVGAGLCVRTLRNLYATPTGIQVDQLLLFSLNPPSSRYPSPQDLQLHHRIEERLAAVPGVESVSVSSEPLLASAASNMRFLPDGVTEKDKRAGIAFRNDVGSGFFRTLGIPILYGRGILESDTETSPKVAVVNQALVRKYFPNSYPIGAVFKIRSKDKEAVQIVGVCADAKYFSLTGDVPETAYLPYRQTSDIGEHFEMTYEIRTKLSPSAILPSIRETVAGIDKDIPVKEVRTQKAQIQATIAQQRVFAALTSGFGVLALTLACIGIYGVMAYNVAQRKNEIGIRMALGAEARQMLLMILRESSWISLLGVVIGVGGALALSRYVKSIVYGLKANDPWTLAGVALLHLLIALLAGWIPARRAARIQPMQALRHE